MSDKMHEMCRRIEESRAATGLSREKVAQRLNVSSRTIERWEKCVNIPSDGDLALLADVLGVSPDWLRTGVGEMHTEDPEAMVRQGYEAFVQAMPYAVALLDTDLRFLSVNAAYLAAWDLGERDIVGQTMYEVFPDISEEGRDRLRRVLAGESIRIENEPYSWKRASGRVYWSRLRMFPWYAESGAVAGIVVMCAVSEDVHRVPSLSDLPETIAPSGEISAHSPLDTGEIRGYDKTSHHGEEDMVITSDFIEAMGKGAEFVADPAVFLLIARLMAKGKAPRVRITVEGEEPSKTPKP